MLAVLVTAQPVDTESADSLLEVGGDMETAESKKVVHRPKYHPVPKVKYVHRPVYKVKVHKKHG